MRRRWESDIEPRTLQSIQDTHVWFDWRDILMAKNPFDLALYQRLLWRLKPRTIIEIGSLAGGSALFFADMLEVFGIDGRVLSIDIERVTKVSHPRVTFLEGDGRALGAVLGDRLLAGCPHPWLVVDDADHRYATCLAILDFFAPRLAVGDYVAVEDGIVSDLGIAGDYDGGPNRALAEFLARSPGFVIDEELCDCFGHNFTWNTNGYLRRAA